MGAEVLVYQNKKYLKYLINNYNFCLISFSFLREQQRNSNLSWKQFLLWSLAGIYFCSLEFKFKFRNPSLESSVYPSVCLSLRLCVCLSVSECLSRLCGCSLFLSNLVTKRVLQTMANWPFLNPIPYGLRPTPIPYGIMEMPQNFQETCKTKLK